MMGKDQVGAAAVNIYCWAKIVHTHGRTLDVPARASRSPRAIPMRFAWTRCLPQHKIEGVALVRIIGEVAALVGSRQHFGIIDVCDFTKFGIVANVVVDAAVSLVGKMLCQ